MEYAGSCLPKMAVHRICIATSPEYTPPLHRKNTHERYAGCLACASCHCRNSLLLWNAAQGRCEDNIIAALEHRDRVQRIFFWCVLTPRLVAAMQEPFPELTDLEIMTGTGTEEPAILLDSFLGGSAPRLRTLRLQDVRGPALQRLLLSAHDLTKLYITVPQDSVLSVSPEAMVTCLSTMTKLRDLELYVPSVRSGLDPLGASGRRPPQTRTILPSLIGFRFEGNNEYLGDFVARIDAPFLESIKIVFDQLHFDTLQLLLFIGRTERFKLLVQAEVTVYDDRIELSACPQTRSSYSVYLCWKPPAPVATWMTITMGSFRLWRGSVHTLYLLSPL
jgi:hypothetical protein